ncbi:MAG: 50S ribosomal protein L11 methyltransferase [Nitrosomonadales bacterium]|nr:50S ribosomal protein L11 methyltransferase [Nitrosomonadales bacterium]
MPWLTLTVDTEAEHAEALSEALLELGALSVDLLDADADTPDEQAIFGEPGEPPPGVWQHNRVSALFEEHQDVAATLRDAAARIGLQKIPEYRIEPLADNDWVRLTQSQFDPIPISARLWIVPTWHTSSSPRGSSESASKRRTDALIGLSATASMKRCAASEMSVAPSRLMSRVHGTGSVRCKTRAENSIESRISGCAA